MLVVALQSRAVRSRRRSGQMHMYGPVSVERPDSRSQTRPRVLGHTVSVAVLVY